MSSLDNSVGCLWGGQFCWDSWGSLAFWHRYQASTFIAFREFEEIIIISFEVTYGELQYLQVSSSGKFAKVLSVYPDISSKATAQCCTAWQTLKSICPDLYIQSGLYKAKSMESIIPSPKIQVASSAEFTLRWCNGNLVLMQDLVAS